ncbi:MAG: hypothetical protein HY000_32525, partial [Planctomycetes bacterium]|nr:hypothetical protein [Planctomycetota bacterium]
MSTQSILTARSGAACERRFVPASLLSTAALVLATTATLTWLSPPTVRSAEELLPKHVTPETLKAVRAGMDYLARNQGSTGGWQSDSGWGAYPVAVTSLAGMAFLANGNSPTRGPYAPQVRATAEYLIKCTHSNGLLSSGASPDGSDGDSRGPMHGHGFALLFLASVYGMETKESVRVQMKDAIDKAIILTARAQSSYGGWTYSPGGGDEGSVTVT